ncbi:TFIID-18kDa-domain-containing protein [Epithele typhae]|uniref:TFIID-18kDa-domain-containing protein n=1 Tax=Epithele typhae TaxID=378194 RepID=UPI002007D312|nr:TFIID-18kDa-domain-containing protein [Epithele typhae]KAH9939384.1 TFIID-18kDa-domain-containing protein [Epithele typhae]
MAPLSKTVQAETTDRKAHLFTTEISQMMYVFGEVIEPLASTANLVEDIVRSQVVEIILQARETATRRRAKHVAAEDLLFVVRHDRAKADRLRTYLSWKEVRKHARAAADATAGAGGAVDADADAFEEEDTAEDLPPKPQKLTVRLPWELSTVYTAGLPQLDDPSDSGDDDDAIAYAASQALLKDADARTRAMTGAHYAYFARCRRASFTSLHVKRFREFLGLPPGLALRPGDTVDVASFLAFETVGALTRAALAVKAAYEEAGIELPPAAEDSNPPAASKLKRKRGDEKDVGKNGKRKRQRRGRERTGCSLFVPPPGPATALRPEHVREAFTRLRMEAERKRATGMGNFRGGLRRTATTVI